MSLAFLNIFITAQTQHQSTYLPEMQKNATQYDHELGVPLYQNDLLQTILNTHKIIANITACFQPVLLGCTASQMFN